MNKIILISLVAAFMGCSNKNMHVNTSPISPLHKADECPQISGQWDYEFTGKEGDLQVSKDFYFTETTDNVLSFYDVTEGESWLIDGATTELASGKTVLAFCSEGLIHFDIHDDGQYSETQIQASDAAGKGIVSLTQGGVTTTATLTKMVNPKPIVPPQPSPSPGSKD